MKFLGFSSTSSWMGQSIHTVSKASTYIYIVVTLLYFWLAESTTPFAEQSSRNPCQVCSVFKHTAEHIRTLLADCPCVRVCSSGAPTQRMLKLRILQNISKQQEKDSRYLIVVEVVIRVGLGEFRELGAHSGRARTGALWVCPIYILKTGTLVNFYSRRR